MTSPTTGQPRRALVTGATGYVGSQVAAALLEDGWAVRALSRSRAKAEAMAYADAIVPEGETAGAGQLEVVEGDASEREDVARALADVDVAWYLLHSMSGGDFVAAEREMAQTFAEEAAAADVDRIVYLGGLHPAGEELSDHLRSRVEVGEILLNSGVPTAALQAGVVLGDGSSSFTLLRHLSERLPGAIGPIWIGNSITPIAARDAVHFLVAAADLDPGLNRTFDVGGPDTLSYAEMMQRYSRAVGLPPHPIVIAPVATPHLATHWMALITPIGPGLLEPLLGSLLHDTVVKERDLEALVGVPEGGLLSFEEAVRAATADIDTRRWVRLFGTVAGLVAAGALTETALERRSGARPGRLRLAARAGLSFDLAWQTSLVIGDLVEKDRNNDLPAYASLGALAVALQAVRPLAQAPGRPRWLGLLAGAGAALSLGEVVRHTWAHRSQRGVLLTPVAAVAAGELVGAWRR
ncbi:NAD(P)H-binding protein [Corynebacterium guangdongense]|uniref:Uncharacterized protein YbjT (DUF2867 family) n=1 Tax=Corynebacterium guangdongense TaxID=1783348 RepID=A0ABU1ZYF1_9CORY|nr:NAD(P)H-binding protein [Corynebacterium guangdongense]MDR7329875.1 uncharacterized protein YbjT (DUF2867 family) [Corynebacterium guangdongense]WJZ18438.1 NmrA-like family protein [Corynebacterium guangdongense]